MYKKKDEYNKTSVVFYNTKNEKVGYIDLFLDKFRINYTYVYPDFRGRNYSVTFHDAVLKGLRQGMFEDKIFDSLYAYVRNPLLVKSFLGYGFVPNPNPKISMEIVISKERGLQKIPIYVEDEENRQVLKEYIGKPDNPDWHIFELVDELFEGERYIVFATYYLKDLDILDRYLQRSKTQVVFHALEDKDFTFTALPDSHPDQEFVRVYQSVDDSREEKINQLLRYMYGDSEHPGKGVIVYKKDTPGKEGREAVLPVYEISWILENFSEEEREALIDSLRRWTIPVHGRVMGDIIDILRFKDASVEEIYKKTNGRMGLASLYKIAQLIPGQEKAPYRIYLAISESGAGEAKKIEVEGYVEVQIDLFAVTDYDSDVATLEVRGAVEEKGLFIGLGYQLLRYAAWKELELGSERVRFNLPGIARRLLKNEGFNVNGAVHGRKEIMDFVLKGAQNTIELLETDYFFESRNILDEINKMSRHPIGSSL
ncbi:MAG: hypothetical protein KJ706_04730 [Candidatus Omnitrophica bacterium]|nr:hypothetical protein [Candidatus Omnitrophota bacterium]